MTRKTADLEVAQELFIEEIELTDVQLEMLTNADKQLSEAQRIMNLIFTGICAARGFRQAKLLDLQGNRLKIQLPS